MSKALLKCTRRWHARNKNVFEKSLRDITAVLDNHSVYYMVIGGLANAKWGNPKATLDIDITLWISEDKIKVLLSDH